MARGILTLRSRGTDSLAEAAKWVVVPALAMYPGSSNIGSSKGASAIDEVETTPILLEAMDYQERPAAFNESVSKAIAEIAKKVEGGRQTGRARLSLWCASSSVVPRSTPIDDMGGVNVMLKEADKASLLIIRRVRHAFGPLADNVVFELTGNCVRMYFVEKQIKPRLIRVVEIDDPNADSTIDEALKTARMTWMKVTAAKLQLAFLNMTQKQNRPVKVLPLLENSEPWIIQVAYSAAALSARDNLSEETACWLHDVDSRVINRWCEEYFEKPSRLLLRFEKFNERLTRVYGKRIFWDKYVGRLDDFVMHVNAKLRSTFESNPKGAPTFDAPLEIQECNPVDFETFQSKLGDTRKKVIVRADVPVIPGEKWIKIVRNMWDDATNRVLSSTLVFPSRDFTAAFTLALLDQDFRTFPGYISVWEREKAPQEKK